MSAPHTPSDVAALARSILDTHHALLKRELPLLEAGLRDADPAVRVPFGKLVRILNEHLMKEEVILFPSILALAAGHGGAGCGVHGPIAQMGAEHDIIRALEEELRTERARAGTLGPDLLALLDDLSEHARKEDEWLFPAAIRLSEAAASASAEPAPLPTPPAPRPEPARAEPAEARATRVGARRGRPETPDAPAPAARSAAPTTAVRHLGWSGLAVTLDGATLNVDPPHAVDGPLVVTWTERERVAGAADSKGPRAAAPEVLSWLGLQGTPLLEDRPVFFGGFTLTARPYRPIPYATPPEALRKTRSALFAPAEAARRLAFTLRRPASAPLALRIERNGHVVVLLGQALHRFLSSADVAALAAWAGPADLVVAGTDYDDEVATGEMLRAFSARAHAVADLTGEIRRALRLPVRPLAVASAAGPPGTRRLGPRDALHV